MVDLVLELGLISGFIGFWIRGFNLVLCLVTCLACGFGVLGGVGLTCELCWFGFGILCLVVLFLVQGPGLHSILV